MRATHVPSRRVSLLPKLRMVSLRLNSKRKTCEADPNDRLLILIEGREVDKDANMPKVQGRDQPGAPV